VTGENVNAARGTARDLVDRLVMATSPAAEKDDWPVFRCPSLAGLGARRGRQAVIW
jgi:hypothetical protein